MRNTVLLAGCLASVLMISAPADSMTATSVVLRNDHIHAEFSRTDGVWSGLRLARADRADELTLQSDQFEVLGMDGTRVDVKDYRIVSMDKSATDEGSRLVFEYALNGEFAGMPSSVEVIYELGSGPYLHKQVNLTLREGDVIDRLQVLRFSSALPASRGGEGQPVFLGNWFAGMDYPFFYSRHSNGFTEPAFYYRWCYTIDLEDGNRELEPRDGLVTLFHFPGHAKQQKDGSWGIQSKQSVIGLSTTPGENAELGLLDYIAETRRPPRSHLHHNNWYNWEDKHLTVDGYVNTFARTLKENLAKYGANLDAMVPDDGWQNRKTYTRIYEPNGTDEPLPLVGDALRKMDIDLGIWLALDGSTSQLDPGIKRGYVPAVPENYKAPHKWGGQKYFDILNPLYQRDLKESLRFLIEEAGVNYMKHDFNHCFTPHYLRPRHAREACFDVTLDLIAYERSLCPDMYINYTNGSTFSPFWLQFMECMWMQSSDAPNFSAWPQLSQREGATSYRNNHFYKSFNNPDVCVRPVLPIANFMTHGILFSERKPFTDFKDTLLDWSNYVMMYMGRGTLLKELYTSNSVFDDAHWEVLGKSCTWAQKNQSRLLNTVLVGGDCAKGEVYGYVSWTGDRALLSVRNPDRCEQVLEVPFDETVYYRGKAGVPYHARAIYPFAESMPWKLVSGKTIQVTVPGDSVQVFEIEPGSPVTQKVLQPELLSVASVEQRETEWIVSLDLPNEMMPRCDLLIESRALANAKVQLNGTPVKATRSANGSNWTLASYDLRAYQGQTVTVELSMTPCVGEVKHGTYAEAGGTAPVELWLVTDRSVEAAPLPEDELLPPLPGHEYRRQTQCLIKEYPIRLLELQ